MLPLDATMTMQNLARCSALPPLTRRVSGYILLSLLILISCVASSRSQNARSDLPNVLKLFPGYHLQTLKELDSDARSYVAEHYPRANPSVVHADFDGDGSPDYALLLKNNRSEAAELVVVLCPSNGSCKSVYESNEPTMASLIYLRPAPVGSRVTEKDAIGTKDEPRPFTFNSAGIEVHYFEKATVVLYWDRKHNKIEEVQTED